MDMQQYSSVAGQFLPFLNFEHGIRMDYPSTWTFREQGGSRAYTAFFASPKESPSDTFLENLTINVFPLFTGSTLDSFAQGYRQMLSQMPVQITEFTPAVLADKPAYRVAIQGQLPAPVPTAGRSLMFLVVIGVKGYEVTYMGQQGHYELFLPTVNQMHSTLQLQ